MCACVFFLIIRSSKCYFPMSAPSLAFDVCVSASAEYWTFVRIMEKYSVHIISSMALVQIHNYNVGRDGGREREKKKAA